MFSGEVTLRKGKVVEVGTSLVRWNNTKKASVAGVLPENTENRKMGGGGNRDTP